MIDKDGKVVKHYKPPFAPLDIKPDIEALINAWNRERAYISHYIESVCNDKIKLEIILKKKENDVIKWNQEEHSIPE